MPTFRRTLREQRVPALAWSIALVALGFIHVLMFPQYREAASVLDENAYYRALAGAAGGLGTPPGYLNAEYFTGAPLLVLIFVIIAGTGMIASEQSNATLDFLLAQPVRRSRIILEKAAALAVLTLVVAIASLPGLILGTLFVDFDISTLRMAAACLAIVPLAFLYAMIALFGSAVMHSRIEATVVVIGAALAGFFLNAFGAFADVLEVPRKASPFYWTDYSHALTGEWDWVNAILLVGIGVLVLALTIVLFEYRDLGTSGRRLALPWRFSRSAKRPAAHARRVATQAGRLPTFQRTIREQRVQFTAWSATVLVLAFVTVVIYPQFRDAFAAFDDSGAFAGFGGEAGSISSPAGYLNTEFFSYVPLLVLIAVVIAGTGTLAGEETAGTLDLVLAQPVTRRRLLLEKTGALLALLIVTALASVPGLVIASVVIDFDISVMKLTLAAIYMIPLCLLFLSLAIFAGAALANRTMATIVVVGAAIAAYFLSTLGAFVSELEQTRKISPFYWADFSRILIHGFDYDRAGIFIGISVVLVLSAVVLFERRDIGPRTSGFRLRRRR